MASLLRRPSLPRTTSQCCRAFSTTRARAVDLQWKRNHPDALADTVPSYPYGPARWYKQSSKGLYGGQMVRFGNNVSDDFEIKTRRAWYPNIVTKKLYSKALERNVQVRVSVRVLRTIDKLGGLDEYLLGEKQSRIKELGESGWWLRWAIMQTRSVRKRFAEQRAALGLPEKDEEESAVIEAMPEEVSAAAAAEAVEEGEVLQDDGTIVAEEAEKLPPLRWRVGPGQHLILTAQGWRRVREDPSRRANLWKKKLVDEPSRTMREAIKQQLPTLRESVTEIRAQLDEIRESHNMTNEEARAVQAGLMRDLSKAAKHERETLADALWAMKLQRKEEGVKARAEIKQKMKTDLQQLLRKEDIET